MEQDDHDILIEIRSDQKHYIKVMEEHFKEDEKNFGNIRTELKDTRKDVNNIQRWRWQVVGAVGLAVFLIELGSRVWAR